MTLQAPTSSMASRSDSSTSTSTSTSTASFGILATTFVLGTICFALLVLPRASSFSLSPSSHSHGPSSRAITGTNNGKASRMSSLFQSSTVVADAETNESSSSIGLMEEQAGGHGMNRRRRKQRIRNSEKANNPNNGDTANAAIFSGVRADEALPDPLAPFDSVQSVKLISLGDCDGENDSDVRVELRLRPSQDDGDDSSPEVVVIDPRDLHQTIDFNLWMAIRNSIVDVSASQLSVVLGTNYFTSREKLLQDKTKARTNGGANANDDGVFTLDENDPTGLGDEAKTRSNSKACAWGIKMEPLAFAQYSNVVADANGGDEDDDDDDGHPKNSAVETGMHLLKHTDPATQKTYIFGASPDGMITEYPREDGDDATNTDPKPSVGLLEIKSLWARRNKGSLPEFHNCPSRFYDQIQGQMAICDKEWCDLMLFIPPSGGGTTSGGSGKKSNKRKGKSAKKRKKQAAAAAARSVRARKNKGRNYAILRVKRNEKYWNETVLPALVQFCDEVEARTAAGNSGEAEPAVAPEEENEAVAA